MEKSQDKITQINELPSYWTSVGVAAVIFGILYFAVNIIWGYYSINSEPSGSMYAMMSQALGGSIGCLIGGFGGMLAIWHYVNLYDGLSLKLGKGALIGFLTALGIAIVGTILSQIWNFIDPAFTDKLMESMIANYEQMEGISDAQRRQIIDSVASEFQNSKTFGGILKGMGFSALSLSIVNVITALIGVKIFAQQEQ